MGMEEFIISGPLRRMKARIPTTMSEEITFAAIDEAKSAERENMIIPYCVCWAT